MISAAQATWAIAALATLGVIARPWRLPEAIWAVLGAAAALRGYKVIVPIDGMSGDDAWPEAYTAWHLANAARIAPQVTLTRMDMIKF